VFKKVIGQEVNESQKPLQAVTEPRPSVESTNFGGDRAAASAPRPATGTRNVLSSDVEIKGTVKFQDALIVDGKIEGDIQSTGNLTIGENARIKAEVKTGSVIVYGKIHGNLTAIERVELKSSAEVVGDIKAKILMIEAGAIFVGKSTVGTPSQATPSQPELKAIVNQATPSQAAEAQPSLAEK
jgi:cytoskeletal protein CcmA (bactofilin family)